MLSRLSIGEKEQIMKIVNHRKDVLGIKSNLVICQGIISNKNI